MHGTSVNCVCQVSDWQDIWWDGNFSKEVGEEYSGRHFVGTDVYRFIDDDVLKRPALATASSSRRWVQKLKDFFARLRPVKGIFVFIGPCNSGKCQGLVCRIVAKSVEVRSIRCGHVFIGREVACIHLGIVADFSGY